MSNHSSLLLHHLRRLAALAVPERASDAELLRRFAHHQDELAFATLVGRHGPAVLGVCRRVLHDVQQAEDVFQATFLVLACKAGSIRKPETLAAWLHGVARNLAVKCQRANARRVKRETRVARTGQDTLPDPLAEVSARELLLLLDEEVQRLPELYRLAVILCYLEGKTQEEAAQQLGWTPGCVKGRLERGRQQLRRQLTRRGVALSAVVLAALTETTSAAMPPLLAARTVRAALLFEAGSPAIGTSESAVALAAEAVNAAPAVMLRWITLIVLLAGTVAAGAGSFLARPPDPPHPAKDSKQTAGPASVQPSTAPRVDRQGDPLPRGSLARLGTMRFRQGYGVLKAVYSPDQQRIASVGRDGGLRLWEATTGRLLWRYQMYTFQDVAFSPDGRLVACEGPRGTIVLLDAQSGQEKHRLDSSTPNIRRLAFAPDSRTLAFAGWGNGVVGIVDIATGKLQRQLRPWREQALALAFSPDGTMLATGGDKGTIALWDPATGKQIRQLRGHLLAVHSLAFSPNGRILASASADGTVREWQVATGKPSRVLGKPDPKAPWPQMHAVGSVAFSPDGKHLASGHATGQVILRDAATARVIRRWPAHNWWVGSLMFSPDSKTLLTGASLFTSGPRQWDVATGKQVHPTAGHQGPVEFLRFSVDGRHLVSASVAKEVLNWDVAQARVTGQFHWHSEGFDRFALSPNGKLAATWGWPDYPLRLWDRTTGRVVRSFGKHQPPAVSGRHYMTFSPDGRLLAAATNEHAVRVWDMHSGKEVQRLGGCASDLCVLIFSPDGKLLAGGTQAKPTGIYLWDMTTGRQLRRIDTPDPAEVLAISPDSKVIACTGGYNRPVSLWDVASGQRLGQLIVDDQDLTALAFSPDGRFLAAGGWTGKSGLVCVWELCTGQLVRRYTGSFGWALSLDFSPDSMTLATGNEDSTILLWDLTGRQDHGRPRPWHANPTQLDAVWTDLAGEPSRAFDAYWVLVAAPDQAVPFLARHLRPEEPADSRRVAQLIAELDSPRFKSRQQATTELANLGEAAAPLLRKALARAQPLETRRRLRQILADWDWQRSPARFRLLRAIGILQRIGTPPARTVLKRLAAGAPDTRLTREAQAALRHKKIR